MTEAVIFDCGSGFTKVGYSGSRAPSVVFPTVVGEHRHAGKAADKRARRVAVGEEVIGKDRAIDVVYPIQQGSITNWEEMEMVWEYIMLNHMVSAIEDTPLLMSETPLNSKKSRERIVETMFETYKPPSIYLALKPVLAMYAHGDTTGCVLQSGDDVTHALCVKDGYAISGSVVKSALGGRVGTIYMQDALQRRMPDSDLPARWIKERCGVVSIKQQAQNANESMVSFALPDGQRVEVGKERFAVADANFSPGIIGAKGAGFVQSITDSVSTCNEVGLKKLMYENIVLSGGNTMYRHMDARLKTDITESLDGRRINVNVSAALNRKYYAWLGGSVISSLSTFRDMWISEQDYKENGANVVSQKCPFYASSV